MFAQSEYIKLSGSRRPARVLRLMAVGRRRSINANPTHWHVIGSFNDRVKEGILSPNTIGIVAYTSVVTLTVTRGSSIPQFLGPSTLQWRQGKLSGGGRNWAKMVIWQFGNECGGLTPDTIHNIYRSERIHARNSSNRLPSLSTLSHLVRHLSSGTYHTAIFFPRS